MGILKRIEHSKYVSHETKRSALFKFLAVLGIVLIYFSFVSMKYGLDKGLLVGLLTWSFFVFCTPIADAGFLLDFPLRILTGIRMFHSEMLVWLFALLLNVYALMFRPEIYDTTLVLRVFREIIFHPFPFGIIVLLSAVGTFLSVYFGDEMIDVHTHKERKKFQRHKKKYKFILMAFVFVFVLVVYDILLNKLGIHVPLL